MSDRVRAAPTWLRDGFGAMWHEVRSYLATSWELTHAPATFAATWFEGKRTALNPLAMLATGATVLAAVRQLAMTILGLPRPDSLISAVASALGPYAHYVLIGILCHLAISIGSRDRTPRLTDTIAMALYAGAGPAALAEAIGWLLLCALMPLGHAAALQGVMLGLAFTVFCFVLATELGGLHRPAAWRVAFAFAVAFPITGLVFGFFEPPGSYGLHWVMRFSPFYLGLGM
jgi:hypothetical protein